MKNMYYDTANNDILIYNAKVWTGTDEYQEAILLSNQKIQAIGKNEQLQTFCNSETIVIDANRQLVLPGFHDSHMHLHGMAVGLRRLDLTTCKSMNQLIEHGKQYLMNHPDISILEGRGWNQDYFMEQRLPSRYDLDAISTTIPIIFIRACGHVLVCNSAALHSMHIHKNNIPVIAGGQFDIDKSGELTGIVRENAMEFIYQWMPNPSLSQMQDHIKEGIAFANQYGITSIQTNDINGEQAETMFEAYEGLAKTGELNADIYHQCCFMDIKEYKDFMKVDYQTSSVANRIGSLKLFVDGSLGARTALLRQPYADDSTTTGMQCLTKRELYDLVSYANENDMQVAIHAIGDQAMELVLDVYEGVMTPGNPLRHGVVHCQITDTVLLERFAKLQLVAYVQPVFLHYDQHIVVSRVGETLANTSYAFHTMEKLGIVTAYGSDSPVEHCNPLLGIYCAVTRSDLTNSVSPYLPQEAVTVQQAINHFTLDSAYSSFSEGRKGKLAVGFDGDVIMLDTNILECDPMAIKDTNVLLTIARGNIVYQR